MKTIACRLVSGRLLAFTASIAVSMALLFALLETSEAVREQAQTANACANSVAVSGHNGSAGLVSDCEALLTSLDTLVGDASLN